MFRIAAPGGLHLVVRRHAAAELALWLPAGLAPISGAPFGVYVHADRHLAAMLCIHDLAGTGMPLRDMAGTLARRLAVNPQFPVASNGKGPKRQS